MIEKWSVGEKAPGVWGEDTIGKSDGAILEQSSDGSLTLALLLQRPTKQEIRLIEQSTIESACYFKPPFWLGMLRFAENRELSFDISFDITVYPIIEQQYRINCIKSKRLLFVVLIDTVDGIVKAIRAVTMSDAFCKSLYLYVGDPHSSDFTANYEAWRNKIYHTYDIPALWEVGNDTGIFGKDESTEQE